MKLYYDPAYVGAKEPFDTTRKSANVAALSASIPGVVLKSPQPASLAEIRLAHASSYVNALKTGKGHLASSAGFTWDRGYFQSILSSTGGVIDAALTAMADPRSVSGSLSSGLHHASHDSGAGFCSVNGLAVAAKIAVGLRPKTQLRVAYPARAAERVLILDLDAHCGGGTYQIIQNDHRIYQSDVSVNYFDSYEPVHSRHRLHVVQNADAYLATIERELEWAATEVRPSLVLYNAGMDPHEDSGGLTGITTEILRVRERMVFDWAAARGIPLAFVLAGGYTGSWMSAKRLAALHAMTVAAAAQQKMPTVPESLVETGEKPIYYNVVPANGGASWSERRTEIEAVEDCINAILTSDIEYRIIAVFRDGTTETIQLKGTA